MSPLALLKEGEAAEIVGQHRCECKNEYDYKHGHARKRSNGDKQCCGRCGHCTGHSISEKRTSDYLTDMGLRPGKRVEMITNNGRGPLVLMVDELRIAMGRGAAMKIYVRMDEE